jgi:tetratricopeptide (TPR) repeat protein
LANALLLRAAPGLGREIPKNAADNVREANEIIQELRSRQVSPEIGESRVDLLSRYGHWIQAVALCRPLYQETPLNAWTAFRLGLLLVETGQTQAYEILCQELLRSVVSSSPTGLKYSEFRDEHSLDAIVMTACLRSPTEANLLLVRTLAPAALTFSVDTEPHRSWFLMNKEFTNALVDYRAGNHDAAIAALEPLIPRLSPSASVGAQAVLAMARFKMVDEQAALTHFHSAESLFRDNWFSDKRIALEGNPHDWLVANILLREAGALLRVEE